MFSGIVECTAPLLRFEVGSGGYKVFFQCPKDFDDLKIGDSIAVNGVCLTVEKFSTQEIQFTLGAETLKILRFQPQDWMGKSHNLERSLKLSDRIHGHLVTGHVESLGRILRSEAEGDNWLMDLELPEELLPYVWKKGSITLHGVSLTMNELDGKNVSVCLIPETQKRTNLTTLKAGEFIHLEADYLAKAFHRFYSVSQAADQTEPPSKGSSHVQS